MAEGARLGLKSTDQRRDLGDQLQRSDLSRKWVFDREVAAEHTQIEGDEQRGTNADQKDRAHKFQLELDDH